MLEYERQMVKYEQVDNKLQHIAPMLRAGKRELIPEFHDESSFHAFEYRTTVW